MSYNFRANFYSELLRTTLESCRRSNEKHIKNTTNSANNLVEEHLVKLITTRLPLTDQKLISKFVNARLRGLNAARQGNLMAAECAFIEARIPLQLNKFSLEGSLLYESLLEQSQSYLDYRRGDFDKARNRIFKAIANDVVLEEKYGYEILFLHRIHLAHNLVRIDAQRKCFQGALELACQILSYLEGVSELLPIPGIWGYELVARQSPELVAVMFAEITSEVAIILAGQNRQLARHLFAVSFAYFHLETDDYRHCHPQAYFWLLIKQAFLNNDFATFLGRASNFLAFGRADTPVLWYATLIDLITLCDEFALPDSELVRREVASSMVTWEKLPQKFSSLLCNCANAAAV
ncbi:MAG: hypothetical protein KME32_16550 [Mojavia pulchra JT2-VF2]|jgi:hypothetical protein|uniref:Uncharacterized protein n=1 Tax=Mojavia pulchra JT2-VF2 TaxID=287848 RepID=A0A951Q1G7_9NOST|nr:hypothetical protein [Mojavia pulchra JT2-VF2]